MFNFALALVSMSAGVYVLVCMRCHSFRTTLMLRNIPPGMLRTDLEELFDRGPAGAVGSNTISRGLSR